MKRWISCGTNVTTFSNLRLIHPRCCSPPRSPTLRRSPSLRQRSPPDDDTVMLYSIFMSRLVYGNEMYLHTNSLCAFIWRSISSGLLNCFPLPLWPFFPKVRTHNTEFKESFHTEKEYIIQSWKLFITALKIIYLLFYRLHWTAGL